MGKYFFSEEELSVGVVLRNFGGQVGGDQYRSTPFKHVVVGTSVSVVTRLQTGVRFDLRAAESIFIIVDRSWFILPSKRGNISFIFSWIDRFRIKQVACTSQSMSECVGRIQRTKQKTQKVGNEWVLVIVMMLPLSSYFKTPPSISAVVLTLKSVPPSREKKVISPPSPSMFVTLRQTDRLSSHRKFFFFSY